MESFSFRRDGPAFCYALPVPLGTKQWITANQRLFWRVRSTRTKAWREETALLARRGGLPRLERAYVIAELSFADKRRRDPANWAPTAKACVDGLVDAGVFADDHHRIITGPDMRIDPDVRKAEDRALMLYIYPLEGKK